MEEKLTNVKLMFYVKELKLVEIKGNYTGELRMPFSIKNGLILIFMVYFPCM